MALTTVMTWSDKWCDQCGEENDDCVCAYCERCDRETDHCVCDEH